MAACLLLQKKKIAAGGDPFSRTCGLAAHSYLSDTFRVCLAHKCDRSRVATAAFCFWLSESGEFSTDQAHCAAGNDRFLFAS